MFRTQDEGFESQLIEGLISVEKLDLQSPGVNTLGENLTAKPLRRRWNAILITVLEVISEAPGTIFQIKKAYRLAAGGLPLHATADSFRAPLGLRWRRAQVRGARGGQMAEAAGGRPPCRG